MLSTSEVGPILALIAPSHLIRKLEGHKNKVTKCNKNQSKGENKAPKIINTVLMEQIFRILWFILIYWFKEKVSYIYTFNYHYSQTIFFATNYPLRDIDPYSSQSFNKKTSRS
jgi:hypothetical protein